MSQNQKFKSNSRLSLLRARSPTTCLSDPITKGPTTYGSASRPSKKRDRIEISDGESESSDAGGGSDLENGTNIAPSRVDAARPSYSPIVFSKDFSRRQNTVSSARETKKQQSQPSALRPNIPFSINPAPSATASAGLKAVVSQVAESRSKIERNASEIAELRNDLQMMLKRIKKLEAMTKESAAALDSTAATLMDIDDHESRLTDLELYVKEAVERFANPPSGEAAGERKTESKMKIRDNELQVSQVMPKLKANR